MTRRCRTTALSPRNRTGPERQVIREATAADYRRWGCGLLPLRGPDLQMVEQRGGGGRDGVDRVTERLGVVPGGRAETADLPHVLQRGGADIVVGHLLGVGRAKGLDAPAHSYDRTWPVRTVLTPEVRAYSKSGADRKSTRLNSSHLGISYAVF